MTGGGRARRGGMGTKVTAGLVNESQPDNTPQMKRSIEELERRVSNLLPSIAASERKEQQTRQTIHVLEDEYKRLSIDIQVSGHTNIILCDVAEKRYFSQHLTKNVPALEDKLKKLKEDVAKNVSDEAEVSRLEGELKKAQNGTLFQYLGN
jgi:chromosome segregation ATPase